MSGVDTPHLVGGIGLTELAVYEDRPGPDGRCGGCAHMHALTDEAYYVLEGTGFVDLHDLKDGFRRVALRPGMYIQFPPLTLHRIVSDDGLRVLALMGNAGLAERGDARIYFGPDVDADPARYQQLAKLPPGSGVEGALARRDASISAYQQLLSWWEHDRREWEEALRAFTERLLAQVRSDPQRFAAAIAAGPERALRTVQSRLAGELRQDDIAAVAGEPREIFGMCGRLQPVSKLEPR
jgi:mannose-6-phosphate isomerase-like protein (cupin superfamily)